MLGKNLITAAAGAGAAGEVLGVEDVFSTWLYTGNGSTQTITNGIDLAGEGGLVWLKSRSAATDHQLFDTARGATKELISNSSAAEATDADTLTAFNVDGFDLGADANVNTSAATYASWTFRKAPKFFDVVTWTGDGVAGRAISHNLGTAPGCIIVKRLDVATAWSVYHRSTTATQYLLLSAVNAATTSSLWWNNTEPTDSVFTVGSTVYVNGLGSTYVAYLFAHDAGGFGDDGTENVISCGSYTGNGSATGPVITLGWEPQWVIVKQSSASGQWWNMIDVMRGFDVSNGAQTLGANASDAEYTNAGFGSGTPIMSPTATGFQVRSAQPATNASGETYIYIAIRRGPMKTPTDATTVFSSLLRTGTGTTGTVSSIGFPLDWLITKNPASSGYQIVARDRLRGTAPLLQTHATSAEITDTTLGITGWTMDGFTVGADNVGALSNTTNQSGVSYINWAFRRAPGFFDVVAYTGDGFGMVVNHSLGVVPELWIARGRDRTSRWFTALTSMGSTRVYLNSSSAVEDGGIIGNFTSTTFQQITGAGEVSGPNIVYLFATCPGVSKVGSYTGTGTTLQIDCGFAAGARLVLIKRTDSSGDWYIWDTARGIVSGNDPYLLINSTAAEVTSTDYIDPYAAGFEISSTAPAAINASGGSFIFLAIA